VRTVVAALALAAPFVIAVSALPHTFGSALDEVGRRHPLSRR